jgi:hypothetical protein
MVAHQMAYVLKTREMPMLTAREMCAMAALMTRIKLTLGRVAVAFLILTLTVME